jgi:hypothetical protein
MKVIQSSQTAILSLLVCAAGCAPRYESSWHSKANGTLNLASSDGPVGFVQFYTPEKHGDNGVWIYQLENDQKPRLLGIIGVRAGGKLCAGPHDTNTIVCETLSIASRPGRNAFLIERDGQRIDVPVTDGMTTPVEVDRKLIDRAGDYDVYRVQTRVLDPISSSESDSR